jgi:hypothetical protein
MSSTFVVNSLLLPAAFLAGWVAVWFVRRPRRWRYFFLVGFGVLLLLAAALYLAPQGTCESSAPMMCVDGFTFYGVANLFSGFWTWVGLLVLTGLVELVRRLSPGRATDRVPQ